MKRLIVPLPGGGEPQRDQAVEQHRGRGGALDRPAGPALRLLETQVGLALLESLLDGPAPGVEDRELLGGEAQVGGGEVEGLPRASAGERLDRHHPQPAPGHGMHAGERRGDPHPVVPPMDVDGEAPGALLEHLRRGGQARADQLGWHHVHNEGFRRLGGITAKVVASARVVIGWLRLPPAI